MALTNRRLNIMRLLILLALLASLGYFIANHIVTSWNIMLAVLGFSAVVFIHECGHFFVAKACDIKVEVFSIFIPPVLFGIRRTEQGWRVRILPQFFPKDNDPEGNGALSFCFGKPGKAGETEYRIGLIPVAGYVKMLGQDDISADKQVSDPRSFGNKSTGARMAVIAAGVTFNVIAAVVIMTIVYMMGIYRESAVIGDIIPGSPADRAGLQMGDRVLAVGNKTTDLEFEDILMASALSSKGEAVSMEILKRDGTETSVTLIAEEMMGIPVRLFGVSSPADSLTVAKVKNSELLYENTQLKGKDRIVAVNSQPIEHFWQLSETVKQTFAPKIQLTVERQDPNRAINRVDIDMPLFMSFMKNTHGTNIELTHVASMIPPLRIGSLSSSSSDPNPNNDTPEKLAVGDIIAAADTVDYPNYSELRKITEAHENKDLRLKILRTNDKGEDQLLDIVVHPRKAPGSERVLIGFTPELDAQRAVVAQALDTNDLPTLPIPRGATITHVAKKPVQSFYDIITQLRNHPHQNVDIAWLDPNENRGSSTLLLEDPNTAITVRPTLAAVIPFERMKDLHKATNPVEAFIKGSKKSVWFIKQTYVTIKQLLGRDVKLKAMSGPVGIATIAYQFVQRSMIDFLYLLAFISANLAVVNFLPMPVVDGGVFIMLLIERIQGRPLSLRVQEIITYAGLAMILSLFIYLTYNDIVRLIL